MRHYDLMIIGSGAAASVTLAAVYDRLKEQPPATAINMAVVEKTGEFWAGIPYGYRSSVNSLIITCVLDFVHEQERPAFFAWLKENKDVWATHISKNGGITGERWLEKNLPLIDQDRWDLVFIPRFVFGLYLNDKLRTLIDDAEQRGWLKMTLIKAEAIDVNPNEGGYNVILELPDNNTETVHTKKLVVAAGSAPVKQLCTGNDPHYTYINDIYDPALSENLVTLNKALSGKNSSGNILVIGSNASSIELLYLLEGRPELRAHLKKIVIISTSGILPYHISTEKLPVHPMPAIDAIKAGGKYTIKSLSEAAASDIKLALKDGANMEYIATIINNTIQLMDPLSDQEKKEFYCIYGIKLRDSFRRSGPEYKGGAQVFIETQQLHLLKGRFNTVSSSDAEAVLNYTDVVTGSSGNYDEPFAAVINCTGSDDLQRSSSRLIYNLINKKICTQNLSGKGIEVTELFEAAPNLYIMGPLLGGNVNKLIHFWQLENVARLTTLSPYLAKELV